MRFLAPIVVGALAILFLFSCSQKTVQMDEPVVFPTGGLHEVKPLAEAPSHSDELQTAFFAYDRWDLDATARAALKTNADWLRAHPQATAQIEGHCDERGTAEYNFALGQRRAEAARDYLVNLGIAAKRLSTVSYGAVPGQTTKNWPSNRKAAFIVVYPTAR